MRNGGCGRQRESQGRTAAAARLRFGVGIGGPCRKSREQPGKFEI